MDTTSPVETSPPNRHLAALATAGRHVLPPLVVLFLFAGAVIWILLPQVETGLHRHRREMAREVLRATWTRLVSLEARRAAGELTLEEAQAKATRFFRSLRYGEEDKDYFWILDTSPAMVMHPYRPDLEGQALAGFRDPAGKKLFAEMVEIAATEGEGFLEYRWQWKDDPARMEPKASYVKLFEPWGWIVGTGVYLDDIERHVADLRRKILDATLAILVLLGGVLVYIAIVGLRTEAREQAARERLVMQEEHYRTLFENSGDALFIIDGTAICLECNSRAVELFAVADRSDIVGRSILHFSPAEQPGGVPSETRARELIGRARTGGRAHYEWTCLNTLREDVPVEVTLSRLPDAEGDRYLGIVRDVRERKRALDLLTQEKRFSETILQTTPAYFVALDRSGRILRVNDAMLQGLGWTRAEVTGRDYFDVFIPGEHREGMRKAFEKLWDRGVAIGAENPVLCRNGERRDVRWYSRAVLGESEEYTFGLGIDVTEELQTRKELEAALRRREELEQIIDNSPIVVFLWRAEAGWPVEYVSETVRTWGYAPEDITGGATPFAALVHPDDLGRITEEVEAYTRNGTDRFAQEYRIRTAGGEDRWVEDRTWVRRDGDGRLTHYQGVLIDITERKAAEASLRESENRLRQADKMRAVGQLAGGIAHDFNNLLAGIMGSTELLLLRSDPDTDARKRLDVILESADQAAQLVRQLLVFSRKSEAKKTTLHLNEVLEDTVEILSRTLDPSIGLEKDLALDLPAILGDSAQIHSAVLNLAVNARDAMPEGGTIRFSTGAVRLDAAHPLVARGDLPPGDYALLRVRDTGTGIDPEALPRIFEPFFTTKAEHQGTGLGLASVFGCLKSHGGAVDVDSTPGEGTVFTLYFPVAAEPGDESGPEGAAAVPRGTGTILLVDDEEILRHVTADSLRMFGYEVTEFGDPARALEHFRHHHGGIDLAILDMIMPGMNGYELFRALEEIRPGLRCLIASGYIEEEKRRLAEESGIAGWIEKPIHLSSLLRAVHEILGGEAGP